MSLLLYGLSLILFVIIFVYIIRKLVAFWQKFFLISVSCLLLLSSIFHTMYYGNSDEKYIKLACDQEAYYYPRINNTYRYLESNLSRKFISAIVHFQRNNYIYPLLYWNIKRVFGPRYFLEGFFFACILNAILFLFSTYIFFKCFYCFNFNNYYLCLCCFIFFQPFVIFRNAIPLANSLTVFSLVLLVYVMLTDKNLYIKLLSLFLCYLAHKIFWLPVLLSVSYILFPFVKKKYPIVLMIFVLCMGIFVINKECIMYDVYIATQYIDTGNSSIPNCSMLKKCLNFYFSPLYTNLSLFFYKSTQGNLWGWLYAIYINFIVLFMTIKICFSFKNYFYLSPQKKQTCIVLIIFIISFFMEGVRLSNYLTANRHASNTLIVWIFLVLLLDSGKNLKDKIKSHF